MILHTMDNVTFELTQAEAQAIARAINDRRSHVSVRGALIPASSIALYPDELWPSNQAQGRLHDGTRVVRRFGRWVDTKDDKVRLDPAYYPEVERDEVLTELEWKRAGLDEKIGTERAKAYQIAITDRKQKLLN